MFYGHINHLYVELCLRTTPVNNLFAVGGCDARFVFMCVREHSLTLHLMRRRVLTITFTNG